MTQAQHLTLNDLALGTKASVAFSLSAHEMRQFAEISGDINPLHVDDSFAQRKGYASAVVYGALLVAKISQLIGMQLPGRDSVWASLSLDFRRPLYVDQAAQVEGTVASVHATTGLIELGLVLRASGQVIAKGKAEVLLDA